MKTIASIIVALAVIATFAVAGTREIPTGTQFRTEWTTVVTNGTATLTNIGATSRPRKLMRVMFHTAAVATGTNTVDLVKLSITNRIATVTQAAVADAQYEESPEYWQFQGDTIIITADNTTTSPCTIVVEYEHN